MFQRLYKLGINVLLSLRNNLMNKAKRLRNLDLKLKNSKSN